MGLHCRIGTVVRVDVAKLGAIFSVVTMSGFSGMTPVAWNAALMFASVSVPLHTQLKSWFCPQCGLSAPIHLWLGSSSASLVRR